MHIQQTIPAFKRTKGITEKLGMEEPKTGDCQIDVLIKINSELADRVIALEEYIQENLV